MIKFTKDHEWIKIENEMAYIGITSHAAESLGTLVYVELPELGRQCKVGDVLAVVESSKSASDVYSPISGQILAVNHDLEVNPELVNSGKDGEIWIVKLSIDSKSELDKLLSKEEYSQLLTH